MTKMVLSDFVLAGRGLRFLCAYSVAEVRTILAQEPDVAVILLDVVMETDDAGLAAVKIIREELGNTLARIILRTGQPGQAPERQVVLDYDINDYKDKSELTAQKLFTAMVAAIRGYSDLITIENNRVGLRKIVTAAPALFSNLSIDGFLTGVLIQLNGLFTVRGDALLCTRHLGTGDDEPVVVAGTGQYEGLAGTELVGLSADDEALIELFCQNAGIRLDNAQLYQKLFRSEQAAINALASLSEYRDDDTGDHVFRVRRYVDETIAILDERGLYQDSMGTGFKERAGIASLLHDVGKVAVPDAILWKPGRLNPDEVRIMRRHVDVGRQILASAANNADDSSYLRTSVEIAGFHHERWDGKGYPHGLKGEEIPLSPRIVAIADVFDALTSDRPYKQAWPIEEVIALLKEERGHHFDPLVLDAFLEMLERNGWGLGAVA